MTNLDRDRSDWTREALERGDAYWRGRVDGDWPPEVRGKFLDLISYMKERALGGNLVEIQEEAKPEFVERCISIKMSVVAQTGDWERAIWNGRSIREAVHLLIEGLCPPGLGVGFDPLSEHYAKHFGYR